MTTKNKTAQSILDHLNMDVYQAAEFVRAAVDVVVAYDNCSADGIMAAVERLSDTMTGPAAVEGEIIVGYYNEVPF